MKSSLLKMTIISLLTFVFFISCKENDLVNNTQTQLVDNSKAISEVIFDQTINSYKNNPKLNEDELATIFTKNINSNIILKNSLRKRGGNNSGTKPKKIEVSKEYSDYLNNIINPQDFYSKRGLQK